MSRSGSNFRMFGTSRDQYASRAATTTFSVSAPTTGDITQGTVVTVEIDGDGATPDTGTTTVRSRATGAIPLSVTHTADYHREVNWSIAGTTLSVTTNSAVGAGQIMTFTFWVF